MFPWHNAFQLLLSWPGFKLMICIYFQFTAIKFSVRFHFVSATACSRTQTCIWKVLGILLNNSRGCLFSSICCYCIFFLHLLYAFMRNYLINKNLLDGLILLRFQKLYSVSKLHTTWLNQVILKSVWGLIRSSSCYLSSCSIEAKFQSSTKATKDILTINIWY